MNINFERTYPVGYLVLVDAEHATSHEGGHQLLTLLEKGAHPLFASEVDPDDGDKPLKPWINMDARVLDEHGDPTFESAIVHDISGLEDHIVLFDTFRFLDNEEGVQIARNTDVPLVRVPTSGRTISPISRPGVGTFFFDITDDIGHIPHISLYLRPEGDGALQTFPFWPVMTGWPSHYGAEKQGTFGWECPALSKEKVEGLDPAVVYEVASLINRWAEIDPSSFAACVRHAMSDYRIHTAQRVETSRDLVAALDVALLGRATARCPETLDTKREMASTRLQADSLELFHLDEHINAATRALTEWIATRAPFDSIIHFTRFDPLDRSPEPEPAAPAP